MTVTTTTNRKTFSGNGSTTVFSYPYKFSQAADLVVIIRVDSTGVGTVQTITTHYSVSGAGDDAGGSVTMVTAPASGETLIVYNDPTIDQDLDLADNGQLPAESIEDRLDKLTLIAQRLDDRADRSVRLAEGLAETFDTLLPADLVSGGANKAILINADGDGFADAADWPSAGSIEGAEASADLAEEWASKTDGIVDSTDYSAKAYAVGGTGVTDTATRGAAKEWAIETASTVDGTEYSAKEYARGTQIRGAANGGSSKDWSTYTGGTVDDTEYSSKEYAQGTQTRGAANGGSAKDWATYTAGTVDNSERSAKYYAEQASTSAAAAQTAVDSIQWNDVVFYTFADSPVTLDSDDRGKLHVFDTSSGAISVTVPEISGLDLTNPFAYGLKKNTSDANDVTINRSGTDVFNGADTTLVLSYQNETATIVPDTDPTPDSWTSIISRPIEVLDEDEFSSNSATAVPSQQSAKAYIDSRPTGDKSWEAEDEGSGQITFNAGSRIVNGIVETIASDITTNATVVAITDDTLTDLTAAAGLFYEASDTIRIWIFYDVINDKFQQIGNTTSDTKFDYRTGDNADFIAAGINLAQHVPLGYVDVTASASPGTVSVSITNFPVQAWTTFNNTAAAEPPKAFTSTPTFSGNGSMTVSSPSILYSRQWRVGNVFYFNFGFSATLGGTGASQVRITDLPITPLITGTSGANADHVAINVGFVVDGDGTRATAEAFLFDNSGTPTLAVTRSDSPFTWSTGSSFACSLSGFYEIADSDAYQPLAVGFPSISDLVTEASITANTAITTENSETDVTGASITLSPGVYQFYYGGTLTLENNDGSTQVVRSRVRITDSSNTAVPKTATYMQQELLTSTNVYLWNSLVSDPVTVASETTYKLRMIGSWGTTGSVTFRGADLGVFTGQDNDAYFFAKKVPQAGVGVLIPPVKYTKKFHTADLTSADNGILSDYTLTNLEVGKTYEVYVQMLIGGGAADAAVSFEGYNESTASGSRVLFARGYVAATGNSTTASARGIFTADNSNFVLNMVSLASGNTILSSGTGELSFMTIKEVFNETATSEWD